MRFPSVFRLAAAALVIGLALTAARPAPAHYAIHMQVAPTAPAGAQMMLRLAGDSDSYVAGGVLKSVCVPVTPSDSTGVTAALVWGIQGQGAAGAVYVSFFPNAAMPQLNIVADSDGVHDYGSSALTCRL